MFQFEGLPNNNNFSFHKNLFSGHQRVEMLHARMLPMLVPPKRWVSHDEGAYLAATSKVNSCNVMRAKDFITQVEVPFRNADLSQIL